MNVTPSQGKKLSRKCGLGYILNRNWTLSNVEENGMTIDGYYIKFINDVLDCIRGKYGKKELIQTCIHVYQIAELLRFEPELNSKLINDENNTYFKVWLSK